MITHSLLDIATATRIESTAKTMSVNSTFTTVAQKADSPSHGRAGLNVRFCPSSGFSVKCAYGQIQQVGGADQLHPRPRR